MKILRNAKQQNNSRINILVIERGNKHITTMEIRFLVKLGFLPYFRTIPNSNKRNKQLKPKMQI